MNSAFTVLRAKWAHFFENEAIEKRILSRGVTLAVLPLFMVVTITLILQGQANRISVTGCSRLALQDLNHVVEGLLGACKTFNEDIGDALKGSKVVFDRGGQIDLDSFQQLSWKAKNQVTSEVTEIRLPVMLVGNTRIMPVSDFDKEAPFVDQVRELFKTSATIFERMNSTGDMLRIATTVKKADGNRAIGTYIPAVAADGTPNPVIRTVMQGKTYLGRAFVVNSWFIAAYQPIKSKKGEIIGMIYTGLPEAQVRDKLERFNNQLGSTGKTDAFVLHTAGPAKGLFVASSNATWQGRNAWDFKDARGALFVQEICRKATAAKPGQISEASYYSEPHAGAPSRKMITRFTYFPEWDWVIGVQQPEEDFLAASNSIVNIFRIANVLIPLICVATGFVALYVWKKFLGHVSSRIESVVAKLVESSRRLATAGGSLGERSVSIARSARSLMRATETQAASAEQTFAATGAVSESARENAKKADQMRHLSVEASGVIKQAQASLKEVNSAMESIDATSANILGIVDAIDEISFATTILSLNASIEAARAGEAGKAFAYIAVEIRDLAGKCSEAAEKTKTTVQHSQSEVGRGSKMVRKLAAALEPLGNTSNQITSWSADVSMNSQMQAQSLSHVLLAVQDSQQSSENTAQAAQKGADDATTLQQQVEFLNRSVADIDRAIDILTKEFSSAPR